MTCPGNGSVASMKSSPEGDETPKAALRRTVAVYVGAGFFLGAFLAVLAWAAEIQFRGLPWSLRSVAEIHDYSVVLWLVDLAPFVGAVVFYFLGRIQAELLEVNARLEERVARRTLQISLEKARTTAVLDTAADGIVVVDAKGHITAFNQAAQRIFGYDAKEVVGRSLITVLPDLNAEGSRPDLTVGAETAGEVVIQSCSTLGLRKDGTRVPIEVDISQFELQDEVVYTAIVRDVTRRIRREKLEESLTRVTEAINQVSGLAELFRAVHDSLAGLLDLTNFAVFLLEENGTQYRQVFVANNLGEKDETLHPVGGSLVGLVIQTRRPQRLGRAELETLRLEGRLGHLPDDLQAWMGVPMADLGRIVGVLTVHSLIDERAYSERDEWMLSSVAGHIANAIDRELAREQLRASEQRYRRMIEEAGEIVYTTDLGGRFTYVNPPGESLTGYPSEKLLGMRFTDLVEETHRERLRKFYREQLVERVRETVNEFPVRTSHGDTRWVEQKTTLILEDGEPTGFESIVHDVTDRKKAEEALREREERFRSLSASSPVGIFQLDARGGCVYANRRFEEIGGRSGEECLGTGWMEILHPEDRETFRTEWIFARDEAAAGGAMREIRVLHPSGDTRWVNVRWAATFNSAGTVDGFVGSVEDITGRKRSERVTQVLYEISRAGQTSRDLLDFFSQLHQALSTIIDTTNFYIALYEAETNLIRFPYAYEMGEPIALPDRRMGKGLTGLVIRTGRAQLLDEESIEELYRKGHAKLIGKPAKNWLGVPLIVEEQVIGAVIIQSYTTRQAYTEADAQALGVVSTQIAASIRRKQAEDEAQEYFHQLEEAHRRIKEDLAVAARIQRSRLPKEAPRIDGIRFGWLFDSCEEVAGDMFNFARLDPATVGVYILDVSGHGIPAALLSMALSRALVATPDGSGVLVLEDNGATRGRPPADVASAMNERFPMNLETNQYFTLLYGVIENAPLRFRFIRAGHPAPILIRDGKAAAVESLCGPAIGIIPGMSYEETLLVLQPGDRVLLYTDGIEETTNPADEEYGLARMLRTLEETRGLAIEDSIRALRERVRAFRGTDMQFDDITMVGFDVEGANHEAAAQNVPSRSVDA